MFGYSIAELVDYGSNPVAYTKTGNVAREIHTKIVNEILSASITHLKLNHRQFYLFQEFPLKIQLVLYLYTYLYAFLSGHRIL